MKMTPGFAFHFVIYKDPACHALASAKQFLLLLIPSIITRHLVAGLFDRRGLFRTDRRFFGTGAVLAAHTRVKYASLTLGAFHRAGGRLTPHTVKPVLEWCLTRPHRIWKSMGGESQALSTSVQIVKGIDNLYERQ